VARTIKVPRVPASAFDKSRRPSGLLKEQVRELGQIAEQRGYGAGLSAQAKLVRSEGQAAAFIAKITERFHPEGALAAAAVAATPPVAVLIAPPRKSRRRKATGHTRRAAQASRAAASRSRRTRTKHEGGSSPARKRR
jgi:hypothetical protein